MQVHPTMGGDRRQMATRAPLHFLDGKALACLPRRRNRIQIQSLAMAALLRLNLDPNWNPIGRMGVRRDPSNHRPQSPDAMHMQTIREAPARSPLGDAMQSGSSRSFLGGS